MPLLTTATHGGKSRVKWRQIINDVRVDPSVPCHRSLTMNPAPTCTLCDKLCGTVPVCVSPSWQHVYCPLCAMIPPLCFGAQRLVVSPYPCLIPDCAGHCERHARPRKSIAGHYVPRACCRATPAAARLRGRAPWTPRWRHPGPPPPPPPRSPSAPPPRRRP